MIQTVHTDTEFRELLQPRIHHPRTDREARLVRENDWLRDQVMALRSTLIRVEGLLRVVEGGGHTLKIPRERVAEAVAAIRKTLEATAPPDALLREG